MLCKFLVSMLFSFELTHNKAEKPKTRKFSGRGDVTSINKGNVCTSKYRWENFPLKWHVHKMFVFEIDGMDNSTSKHGRTIVCPQNVRPWNRRDETYYTSTHGWMNAKTMFWFIDQSILKQLSLWMNAKLSFALEMKNSEVSRQVMFMFRISPRRVFHLELYLKSSKDFVRYHIHGRVEV